MISMVSATRPKQHVAAVLPSSQETSRIDPSMKRVRCSQPGSPATPNCPSWARKITMARPFTKPEHHRVRHHADELAQLQAAGGHLQAAPSAPPWRTEVFHPMVGNQRHHDHGQRAGGAGNHTGPAADAGGDQADHERRVQADQGFDTRRQRRTPPPPAPGPAPPSARTGRHS